MQTVNRRNGEQKEEWEEKKRMGRKFERCEENDKTEHKKEEKAGKKDAWTVKIDAEDD